MAHLSHISFCPLEPPSPGLPCQWEPIAGEWRAGKRNDKLSQKGQELQQGIEGIFRKKEKIQRFSQNHY